VRQRPTGLEHVAGVVVDPAAVPVGEVLPDPVQAHDHQPADPEVLAVGGVQHVVGQDDPVPLEVVVEAEVLGDDEEPATRPGFVGVEVAVPADRRKGVGGDRAEVRPGVVVLHREGGVDDQVPVELQGVHRGGGASVGDGLGRAVDRRAVGDVDLLGPDDPGDGGGRSLGALRRRGHVVTRDLGGTLVDVDAARGRHERPERRHGAPVMIHHPEDRARRRLALDPGIGVGALGAQQIAPGREGSVPDQPGRDHRPGPTEDVGALHRHDVPLLRDEASEAGGRGGERLVALVVRRREAGLRLDDLVGGGAGHSDGEEEDEHHGQGEAFLAPVRGSALGPHAIDSVGVTRSGLTARS